MLGQGEVVEMYLETEVLALAGAEHLPGALAGSRTLRHQAQADDVRTIRWARRRPHRALPEQAGGFRNWDYRYTWVRDGSFSVAALLGLGFTDERPPR